MAGSYRHITDRDNNFIGIDLIDNLGDAHEALEECYDIIQYLSSGDKQKIFDAYLFHVQRRYGEKHIDPKVHTFERFWSF